MARVTQRHLRDRVRRLQRGGYDISIAWAYGKPRCYNVDESAELSPRLPTGQMDLWLDAFICGLETEERRAREQPSLTYHRRVAPYHVSFYDDWDIRERGAIASLEDMVEPGDGIRVCRDGVAVYEIIMGEDDALDILAVDGTMNTDAGNGAGAVAEVKRLLAV